MTTVSAEHIVKLVLKWKTADQTEREHIERQLAAYGYTLIQTGDKVFLYDDAHRTPDGAAAS
jgi:hypothetical protein